MPARPTRPTPHRSAGALTVAGVAVVGLLAGCAPASSTTSPSSGTTPLTVVLDWTPNTNHLGLYLAQVRGYFADAGLDVTIIEPGETGGLQLVASGQADVAYSVAEGLLPARAAGADVVSIATVIQHNTSSLISLTPEGITRPRDLAGKRYGTYGSDLEGAIIRELVACDGGDPDAVEMTPLVSDDFRIGLTQDQFDFAWVMDAWDTIRLRDVDDLDVATIPFIDYTDCIPDWYTPLLATSATALETNHAALEAFLDAITRGYQEAIEDPSAAADALLAAAPELEPELVRSSSEWLASRFTDDPARWGHQDAAVWDGFAGFLTEHDLLDGDPRVAEAWTNELLPGAVSATRPSGVAGMRDREDPPGRAVLGMRGFSVRFGELAVLDDVDLTVRDGEFVAVVGPSGCGKSTLLRALGGLLGPQASVTGSVTRPMLDDGRPATAWMPQRDGLLPWRRALANALLGAQVAGVPAAQARERATALFEAFGLAGFERAWPHELSGGMRQRLALLRTCLAGRPVLLLDEPFGALDPLTRRRMNAWLAGLDLGSLAAGSPEAGSPEVAGHRTDGTAVVLVTHDVDEAVALADRAVVLSDRPGRVVLDLDLRGHPAPRKALLAALGLDEQR